MNSWNYVTLVIHFDTTWVSMKVFVKNDRDEQNMNNLGLM